MNKGPFTAMADALERAARNGRRAHLEADQVRALVQSDAFSAITEEKRRELVATWQERQAAPAREEPNLGRSGSGIERSGMNGASAGMMTAAEQAAVERAESQRALAAVAATKSPRRHKTH